MLTMNPEGAAVRLTRCGDEFGVFAERYLEPGQMVISATAVDILPTRTRHTMQLSPDAHVVLNKPAIYLNHSCHPNVRPVRNDRQAFDFIAVRHIGRGDEIVFDYLVTESDIASPFDCRCGHIGCRGRVGR